MRLDECDGIGAGVAFDMLCVGLFVMLVMCWDSRAHFAHVDKKRSLVFVLLVVNQERMT
jgi:hypothetical protein